MVWYSHVLRNFPQFVVIHTVKGLCSWVLSFCASTVHDKSSGWKDLELVRGRLCHTFLKGVSTHFFTGVKALKYMPDPVEGVCHLGGRKGWLCSRFLLSELGRKTTLFNGRSQAFLLSLMFSWFQSSRVIASFRDKALGLWALGIQGHLAVPSALHITLRTPRKLP